MFSVRQGEVADVLAVAANVRRTDLYDIRAVTPDDTQTAILKSFGSSHRRFAFCWNEQCVAVGGLEFTDASRSRASIWLIGTPDFDLAMRAGGMKFGRTVVRSLTRGVPCAFNFVPEDNATTLRWLRWLGFSLGARHENFRGLGKTCVEVELTNRP